MRITLKHKYVKTKKDNDWHRHFLIFPKRINDELVFLERVERRIIGCRYDGASGSHIPVYEYRTIDRYGY